MERMLQIARERGRLISIEDAHLIEELQLRWQEGRTRLKIQERRAYGLGEEFKYRYGRLEVLRRAAHRLKKLAEADHRKRFGERVGDNA